MNERLFKYYWLKITEKNAFSSEQKELIRYSFMSILWEAEKILALSLAFAISGYFTSFVVILSILASIRWNSGGMHFNTQIRCLISSFVFISIVLVISQLVEMDYKIYFGLLSELVLIAPIVNSNHIQPSSKARIVKKIRACVIVAIIATIDVIVPEYRGCFRASCLWVMVELVVVFFKDKGVIEKIN